MSTTLQYPVRAAFPQIPVSLSTETAAFAQISETGDAQYPCGDASLRCVDLSEVCLFYRSCQAYGYASFIGFMVYMCSLHAFPLSGFSRRPTGILVFVFGWWGLEGNEGRGCVG